MTKAFVLLMLCLAFGALELLLGFQTTAAAYITAAAVILAQLYIAEERDR